MTELSTLRNGTFALYLRLKHWSPVPSHIFPYDNYKSEFSRLLFLSSLIVVINLVIIIIMIVVKHLLLLLFLLLLLVYINIVIIFIVIIITIYDERWLQLNIFDYISLCLIIYDCIL